MGFLDRLTNLDQDQNQGLLAAAAQMLLQSGPSRKPVGLGQVVGGGLMAYQEGADLAKRRKMAEQEAQQVAQMRGLQMQGMESDLAAQAQQQQRAQGVQALTQRYLSGGAQQPRQAEAVISSMRGPTVENAEALEQMQSAPQASRQPSRYEQLLGLSDQLRTAGYGTEADATMKQALEFRPKVKEWKEVTVGDRVLLKPYFEDGSDGAPVTADVARKMEFRDTGSKTVGLDPYTGKVGASITNTMAPGESARLAQAERHHSDNIGLKRQEIAAGGKPPPGYRWSADGSSLQAIPGGPGDKLPESQQKQVVGVNNLSNAIAEYRSELANFSKWNALSPDARARMGTKYNNMMLQAKEAYNLGVLNGPDLGILQSVITDPRSFKGVITSTTALDAQASELDRMMQQMGQVSGQARQPQNMPGAKAPTAAQSSGVRPPMKGQVVQGYKYKGGDPADKNSWERVR